MASRAKARNTNQSRSWWLSGDEICAHCGQPYAYEVGVYCADCDGPSCPHCVVTIETRQVCIACTPDSADQAHER